MYLQAEYNKLAVLFDALPPSLPESPPDSTLPPNLNHEFLISEGAWPAFNRAMHAAFGNKSKGLKIKERGEGLKETLKLINWCLKEIKDQDTASLVKLWIDALAQAARESSRPKRTHKPTHDFEQRNAIASANTKARFQQYTNPPKKNYVDNEGNPWQSDITTQENTETSFLENNRSESEMDNEEYKADSDNESESEDDIVMDNEEVAAILPRKVDPSATSKVRQAAQDAMDVMDANPRNRNSKKRRRLVVDPPAACTDISTAAGTPDEYSAEASVDLNDAVNEKWCPPIYLFFEQVDQDEMGRKDPGTKYYKCCHGNKKILKVTKEMKGSQTGLKNHLSSNFPVISKLYHALSTRTDKKITVLEAQLAANKISIDSEAASAYINSLGTVQNGPIIDALKKQAALNEPKFDPKETERRLTRWLVAANQPFEEVA